MSTAALVPFAALALLGLAAADGRLPRVYAFAKPLATAALFPLLAPYATDALRLGACVGLALATVADALLVRKAERRFFYAGMATFGLAHLAYTAALVTAAGSDGVRGLLTGLVLTGLLSILLVSRLRPRLPAGLALPVTVYAAILTGTVVGASAFFATQAPSGAREAVLLGALLLYAGDAFYAYNRFVSPKRYGQSAGLVLYWGGQLALMLGVAST